MTKNSIKPDDIIRGFGRYSKSEYVGKVISVKTNRQNEIFYVAKYIVDGVAESSVQGYLLDNISTLSEHEAMMWMLENL